ncbi:MAG: sulfopyruvate decarboxylase subunit alpha [Candidatus Hodarchaeales archaeon]
MTFEDEFIVTLKEIGIDIILTNPCAKIKHLLSYIENLTDFDTIQLTREDYGVGIAAGVSMAGKKAILLIQSTGLGNLLNSLASLTLTYQLPLPIFCSWRGVIDETIEAQKKFGRSIEGIAKALNVTVHRILIKDDISVVKESLKRIYQESSVHIFLLSPKLWNTDWRRDETNKSEKYFPKKEKLLLFSKNRPILTRYQAIESIVGLAPDDSAILSNIGLPSKELYSIKDRAGNFYMTGSLGQVSAIGLGLARYIDRPVIVLDGDGSTLMSLGLLPMLAVYGTKNLTIICLDNSSYGSTGDQPTLTSAGIDLSEVALSVGFKEVAKVTDEVGLEKVLSQKQECIFILFKIIPGNYKVNPIQISNIENARRFTKWVEDHRT